jgi:type IV pilus assembly protein PilO
MRFGIREAIFLIVLLAVPVASFVYVFKPRSEQIHKANQEIATKTERLDRLEEVTARISDIDAAIEQGREAIELIEAKLPSEKDVEVTLEEVWNLAAKNGMSVRSVKSEKPVPAAMYMELPLRMEMDGSFDGFYEFMLGLEKLKRITRVHHMTLQRPDQSRGPKTGDYPEGWVKAGFTLSIYFQPQGNAMAAAGDGK